MIKNTFLSLSLLTFVVLGSQANADWVIDFGPGLADGVAVTDIPGTNYSGLFTENSTSGHTWALSGNPGDADRILNIRYTFASLYSALHKGTTPSPTAAQQPIKFSVPFSSVAPEGSFSLVGTALRESGPDYTFTTDPGDDNYDYVTSLTMADLVTNDIIGLNFQVTFDYGTGIGSGLTNTFTLGGAGGLIAAPEPTSAAMIGCALVGLIARRRRKS